MKVKGITNATLGTIVSLMVATGTYMFLHSSPNLLVSETSPRDNVHNRPFTRCYSELRSWIFLVPRSLYQITLCCCFSRIGAGCNIFTASAVGVPLFGFITVLLLAQLFFALLFGKAFRVPLWATLIGLNASAGGPAASFCHGSIKRMEAGFAACRARRYNWIRNRNFGWMFNE